MAVAADVSARNRGHRLRDMQTFSPRPCWIPLSGKLGRENIKSLYLHLLQFASKQAPSNNGDGVMEWITFADSFPIDVEAQVKALRDLDEILSQRSILLGNGLEPSEADTVVFSVIVPILVGLPSKEKEKIPNVIRWTDYIQFVCVAPGRFWRSISNIQLEKPQFEARCIVKKIPREKLAEEKEKVEKDVEVSVSVLNIQVGVIRKAWKHPSADSLLVEEIDMGRWERMLCYSAE